ncbi:MAG: GntR family transcriptional regulator [Anaerolineales bacterium]|jgi:GntR family transcriptional regulator
MKKLIESIQLDFRSGVSIYTQIVEQIKQQVVAGELKPGDQLPTVRALALELRVNFNTVARAYRLLDEAGIISTQQGRGTYILDVPPPERTDKLRRQALEALTRDYLSEAYHLGCSPDEINKALKEQLENKNDTES